MSRRVRLLLLTLLAPLLGGCVFFPPRQGENGTILYDTRMAYALMPSDQFGFCPADRVGCSVPLGSVCFIMLDEAYWARASQRQRVLLLAHEVGHCLDLRKLSLSHGGLTDHGKRWGAYYANPSEGFAEAYARLYLRVCGTDLDSLGWMNARGSCIPPHPRQVTPELIEELGL